MSLYYTAPLREADAEGALRRSSAACDAVLSVLRTHAKVTSAHAEELKASCARTGAAAGAVELSSVRRLLVGLNTFLAAQSQRCDELSAQTSHRVCDPLQETCTAHGEVVERRQVQAQRLARETAARKQKLEHAQKRVELAEAGGEDAADERVWEELKRDVAVSATALRAAEQDARFGRQTAAAAMQRLLCAHGEATAEALRKFVAAERLHLRRRDAALRELEALADGVDVGADVRMVSFTRWWSPRAEAEAEAPAADGAECAAAMRLFGAPCDATTAANAEAELVASVATRAGRNALLQTLNQLRSAHADLGPRFARAIPVLWALLDACQAEGDIKSARMAMLMVETFYRTRGSDGDDDTRGEGGGGDGREYLQEHLVEHPSFRALCFWEQVVAQSAGEVDAQAKQRGGAEVRGAEERREERANSMLGHLSSVARQMLAFGVPRSEARRFIERMGRHFELADVQRAMIVEAVLA